MGISYVQSQVVAELHITAGFLPVRPSGPEDKEESCRSSSWAVREEALTAFDDHLRRARGVCAGTRANYTRWVRAFLEGRLPDGQVLAEGSASRCRRVHRGVGTAL